MLAVFELLVGLLQVCELIVATGFGLRWIFSPTYRRELRESPNQMSDTLILLAALLGSVILSALLGVGVYWLVVLFA